MDKYITFDANIENIFEQLEGKVDAKIDTNDWKRNEFESNEDVEKSRNKILSIAKNNNFSTYLLK